MEALLKYIKGDRAVWLIMLMLSVASLLLVYSSIVTLAYRHHDGNTLYYLFRHGFILVCGLGLMYLAHKVKFSYYSKIAQLALYISIPLLLFTLLIGTSLNSANRWLTIPVINQTFQTSDLAKLALIMYIARFLAIKQDVIKDFQKGFLPMLVPIFIVCGLILPADLSTAAMLFVNCLILMFIGRVSLKHIGLLVLAGIMGLGMVYLIGKAMPGTFGRLDTWVSRIETFSSPDAASNNATYQTDQSKIAIAKGGIVRLAPGHSVQRNFLPHPYSDFIYSIVLEEYGLIGGVFILLLYLMLLFRSIKIAANCPRTFGALLAIGIGFSLVFQAMINMAVAVNLVPVTGQPLPMVSMGGTSIWFTCLAVGIILSVSAGGELPVIRRPNQPIPNAA
ncbi:MAG: FtsW/RodA/SpoVE family cell cycle protein [Flavobacteriales bacterium]